MDYKSKEEAEAHAKDMESFVDFVEKCKCKNCIHVKIIGAGDNYCTCYKRDVKRYIKVPEWCNDFVLIKG